MGNHRVTGYDSDPRQSTYLTDTTERLPYARDYRPPPLTGLQKTTYVMVILLLIVLLLNVIAFDVLMFLIYLRLPQIMIFLSTLRG